MPETEPTLLEEHDEVLRRQVPTKLIDAAKGVMSTAFVPSPRDQGQLSTLRGSVGAEEAHRRWTESGYESAGTWGISVGHAASLDLPSYDDTCLPESPEDHASVDFRAHGKSRQIQLGRKLRAQSVANGPLYAPSRADGSDALAHDA